MNIILLCYWVCQLDLNVKKYVLLSENGIIIIIFFGEDNEIR